MSVITFALQRDCAGERVSAALGHLSAADPAMAALIARVGACGLVITPREPYEALVRAISHQQLHARAAEAILGRFMALYPGRAFPEPAAVLATEDEAMRAAASPAARSPRSAISPRTRWTGRSRAPADAGGLDDEALIERLVTIRGVGRWTVEMLLISTLGRPDVLPVDDFGVREGWRLIQKLPAQPRPRDLAATGAAWAPFRSTAAWYLWRASDEGKKIKPVATLPGPVR